MQIGQDVYVCIGYLQVSWGCSQKKNWLGLKRSNMDNLSILRQISVGQILKKKSRLNSSNTASQ